jgi:hypothetical protein
MTTLTETRAALILKREAIGAATPTGHVISTVVEQMENLQTWERQPWVSDERQTLPYLLKKSLARLGG